MADTSEAELHRGIISYHSFRLFFSDRTNIKRPNLGIEWRNLRVKQAAEQ